jgi:predicted Fe-Mo cluster-binding NifX family protein
MTAPIADCTLLVARGMGLGAHQHLEAIGVQPLLTDLRTIDETIEALVAGKVSDNPKRLHDHGPGQHRP